MKLIEANGIPTHYMDEGPRDAPALVFSNSLGTDLRLWGKILPLLPTEMRIVRYDKRGHGLSACSPSPYTIQNLADDVAALLDSLEIRQCIFVGLSIGGQIAQELAANRPDLIKAAVLSCTAARIGTPENWRQRISAVRSGGLESIADSVLERWFPERFRRNSALELHGWRRMLCSVQPEGYAGCCEALCSADLRESIQKIELPVLAIAGSEDLATPSDLVETTAKMIRDAEFKVIDGAGHLACVDQPESFAGLIGSFIRRNI